MEHIIIRNVITLRLLKKRDKCPYFQAVKRIKIYISRSISISCYSRYIKVNFDHNDKGSSSGCFIEITSIHLIIWQLHSLTITEIDFSITSFSSPPQKRLVWKTSNWDTFTRKKLLTHKQMAVHWNINTFNWAIFGL